MTIFVVQHHERYEVEMVDSIQYMTADFVVTCPLGQKLRAFGGGKVRSY